MSTKRCAGFFSFCLELEFFSKIKRPGFYTLAFYIFIDNTSSKQNKKNPEHPFLDIIKWKTCAKFQQKTILYLSWSSSKFQFFRQKNLVSWK